MNLVRLTKLAKKLASTSQHKKQKMSCIIFKRNSIIGLGVNKLKTHPKSQAPWKTTHCELSAILDVEEEDLNGASVLIYRQRRNGTPGMAKPCSSCQAMLLAVGIKEVYYSTEEGLKHYVLGNQ